MLGRSSNAAAWPSERGCRFPRNRNSMATVTRTAASPPGSANRVPTITTSTITTPSITTTFTARAPVRTVCGSAERKSCSWFFSALALLSAVAFVEFEAWDLVPAGYGWYRGLAAPVVAVLIGVSRWVRVRWPSSRSVAIVGSSDSNPVRWSPTRTWFTVMVVTCCLGGLLVAGGSMLREEGETFRLYWLDKSPARLSAWIGEKAFVVLAQQLALHGLLVPCLMEITPVLGIPARNRRVARVCAALVFGLVHLPSLVVVGLTSAGAYFWSCLYERSGRVVPLVVSHLALAVLAHSAIPERLNYNMRIGAGALVKRDCYRQIDAPPLRELSRILRSDHYYRACGATGQRFVECLYQDALGETPTGQELSEAVLKLRARCRADIVADLCVSDRFAAHRNLHGDGWFERRALEIAARLARPGSDLAWSHAAVRSSRR